MSTNGRPPCFRRSFARFSKRTVRAHISIKHKYYISIKYRLEFPRVRFFSVYRNGGKTTVGQRTQWNGYRFQISSRCDKKPFSPISPPRSEYSLRRRFLQFVRTGSIVVSSAHAKYRFNNLLVVRRFVSRQEQWKYPHGFWTYSGPSTITSITCPKTYSPTKKDFPVYYPFSRGSSITCRRNPTA